MNHIKMSDKQMQSFVCNEMAKICIDLAKTTRQKKYAIKLVEQAKIFKSLSKIWKTADRIGFDKLLKKT